MTDDFELFRDLEEFGIDPEEFSRMDEDEQWEVLDDAGLDPDYYLDAVGKCSGYCYCQVRFPSSDQTYSYRTEDCTISAGDYVMVPVWHENRPTLAQVVAVGFYAESAVPYPLEETKFILRKATEEDLAAKKSSRSDASANIGSYRTVSPVRDLETVVELKQKTRLWQAIAVLLAVIVVILGCMLYALVQTSRSGTSETNVRKTVYATPNQAAVSTTTTPGPVSTPRPTTRPTSTPQPTPRPTATPRRTISTPKPTVNSDPYDAQDYSHPDDFYYDYYDDFWDYEDAEDYWYEHQGD